MYLGRVIGLAWTATLVARLDLGDYGLYAMAFSASGLLVGMIDNPFLARSLRTADRTFARERRGRVSIALFLMIVGLCLFKVNYVVGFCIVIAGGEMALNAVKSESLRCGLVDGVMKLDLLRQIISIAAGGAYLFLSENRTIEFATILYCLPYLVTVIYAVLRYGLRVPNLPGGVRQCAVLSVGAIAGAGYAQGDVLLLGALAGNEAAGTYSIASLIAWSAAGLFLNHANAHISDLRGGKSILSLGRTMWPAFGVSLLVAGLGLVLSWAQILNSLGTSLLILSAFVFFRSVNHVLTVTLTVSGKDVTRMIATLASLAVDFLLLFLFIQHGSAGASVAAALSEVLLFAFYFSAYRRLTPFPRPKIQELV
jgi:O-antigen/teichoic acid export membrane protein